MCVSCCLSQSQPSITHLTNELSKAKKIPTAFRVTSIFGVSIFSEPSSSSIIIGQIPFGGIVFGNLTKRSTYSIAQNKSKSDKIEWHEEWIKLSIQSSYTHQSKPSAFSTVLGRFGNSTNANSHRWAKLCCRADGSHQLVPVNSNQNDDPLLQQHYHGVLQFCDSASGSFDTCQCYCR